MFHSAHIVDYYVEKIHTCKSKDFLLWFTLLNRANDENFVGTGVDEALLELKNSPRFTVRNDKRIAINHYHKPTGAQQHAVRQLCQLGYSIY